MDNLPAHQVTGIRQTIESSGAKLFYLPSYSPDLNPIEFFSKLKSLLRKAAARTVRSLAPYGKPLEIVSTLSLQTHVNIFSKPLIITVN
jgi:transposase